MATVHLTYFHFTINSRSSQLFFLYCSWLCACKGKTVSTSTTTTTTATTIEQRLESVQDYLYLFYFFCCFYFWFWWSFLSIYLKKLRLKLADFMLLSILCCGFMLLNFIECISPNRMCVVVSYFFLQELKNQIKTDRVQNGINIISQANRILKFSLCVPIHSSDKLIKCSLKANLSCWKSRDKHFCKESHLYKRRRKKTTSNRFIILFSSIVLPVSNV